MEFSRRKSKSSMFGTFLKTAARRSKKASTKSEDGSDPVDLILGRLRAGQELSIEEAIELVPGGKKVGLEMVYNMQSLQLIDLDKNEEGRAIIRLSAAS